MIGTDSAQAAAPLDDEWAALTKLHWLDQSTADPIEKARRVLDSLCDGSDAYFFDDGFPRTLVREQVKNVLAVLNLLARAASPAAPAQSKELFQADAEVRK